MKIYIYIYIFLGLLLMSCMEDKGNYDYVTLDQITIDTIHDQTIEVNDTLRIPTKITRSKDDGSELSYIWYKYQGNDIHHVDTLSREKDLEYKVRDFSGTYQIFYQVTDLSTGVSEKASFKMTVVGQYNTGLMILGEADGQPSMAFINDAGNVSEIYAVTNGDVLGKNPVFIGDATDPSNSIQDIIVLCDDDRGGAVLSNSDFGKTKEVGDLFFLKPENFKPQAYYRAYNSTYEMSFANFIISHGKLHARATYMNGQLSYSMSFNPLIEGKYELCPYAIVCPAAYLFYDNAGEGRFVVLRQDMFSMDNVFSVLSSSTQGFDPARLGMQCIYLSEAALFNDEQSGFGIFRENAGGQLQGVRFRMQPYSNADDYNKQFPMALFSKTPINANAVGIDESPGYAMSLARPHLYYSKDNKVYLYDLDNNQPYPVYDVDTVAGLSHSVIDKIYMEYYTEGYSRDTYGSTSDVVNKVLYISSHKEGEAGKNGTIHVVQLADNGLVESRTALYRNICGKTVSMCYKR